MRYDPEFNYVTVDVSPPDRAAEVHERLKILLSRQGLRGPQNGHIVITLTQAAAGTTVGHIQAMLRREWPDADEWITVEWPGPE
jgi:hypothetical protein